MMVDRVEVDPAELDKAGELTAELAESVQGVGGRLRDRLGGLEDDSTAQPWGNDSFGDTFINGKNNDGYGTSKPNLLDGVDGLGGTFDAFAIGQHDAAGQLRSMDRQV